MLIFIWPFLVAIHCQAVLIELYEHTKGHIKIYPGNLFQGGTFASCTTNPSGEIIQITLTTMSVKQGKNPINFFRKLMNF